MISAVVSIYQFSVLLSESQRRMGVVDCLFDALPEILGWKTLLACVAVMLNPLFWNVVSRFEYRTHFLTKTLGGPKRGVALLAVCIVSLNCVRTTTFHNAVNEHPICSPMQNEVINALGYLIVAAGATLVISSSYRLGFFCSFMGDYFGILLDSKVTGFPFNVVDDPMYVGSAMIYLGFALQHASVVGLLLTACIGASYAIAAMFEGPFTSKIYSDNAKSKLL